MTRKEANLRQRAKYVRALKLYLKDPGPDVIDLKIEALSREKERMQRSVYEHSMNMSARIRRSLLALMHEPKDRSRYHKKKVEKVIKVHRKRSSTAPPTWSREQARNLALWRKECGISLQTLP